VRSSCCNSLKSSPRERRTSPLWVLRNRAGSCAQHILQGLVRELYLLGLPHNEVAQHILTSKTRSPRRPIHPVASDPTTDWPRETGVNWRVLKRGAGGWGWGLDRCFNKQTSLVPTVNIARPHPRARCFMFALCTTCWNIDYREGDRAMFSVSLRPFS